MKTSTKEGLRQFLEENLGKVVESRDIRAAVGDAAQWSRRLRELKTEGWEILSYRDSDELKPSQYKVVGMPKE